MDHDVTPKAIAQRKAAWNVDDVMYQLVMNNITFYTLPDGTHNDNYQRTRELLMHTFGPDSIK